MNKAHLVPPDLQLKIRTMAVNVQDDVLQVL